MKRRAHAKINLTLDVLGRREDGYHDLATVMVPLQLHDLLSIELADEDSFTSNAKYLSLNENNSVYQAITQFRHRYDVAEYFKVELKKYIPIQAGLGGGSANAAAAILILNQLLGLQLSQSELEDIAESVGKDVVFCLHNKAALVEGTGERITPIKNNCDFPLLLVKPTKGVSTKDAYELLDRLPYNHYPYQGMIEALRDKDFNLFTQQLGNSLTVSSVKLLPVIGLIIKQLKEFGFSGVQMSGSGSCVFAVTLDEELLERAVKHFRRHYFFVWKTRIKRGNDG